MISQKVVFIIKENLRELGAIQAMKNRISLFGCAIVIQFLIYVSDLLRYYVFDAMYGEKITQVLISESVRKAIETYDMQHLSQILRENISIKQLSFALFTSNVFIPAVLLIFAFAFLIIGLKLVYLKVTYGRKVIFLDVFDGVLIYSKAAALYALRLLYVGLWSLLFILPGIIKLISYSMADYILIENPHMTPNQALRESERIMEGKKGKFTVSILLYFFVLWLGVWLGAIFSIYFLGMLGALTDAFIANIIIFANLILIYWLLPYFLCTVTDFYHYITGHLKISVISKDDLVVEKQQDDKEKSDQTEDKSENNEQEQNK